MNVHLVSTSKIADVLHFNREETEKLSQRNLVTKIKECKEHTCIFCS